MLRNRHGWMLCFALGTTLPGCTSFFAKQAVQKFSAGIEAKDLDQLRVSASADFEEKALRKPEALADLKRLRLPTGKVKVISVEEIDPRTQKAIVAIGEKDKAQEYEYRLTKSPQTGKWEVDDLYLSQDTGAGEVRRSVQEQMDLLLTCREFLEVWQEGSRDEKLSLCEGSLKEELEVLPPNWLKVLAEQVTGSGRHRSFHPEARLNGDRAVVVLPHTEGSLYMTLRSTSGDWRMEDLAIEPKGKDDTGVRSMTKLAHALNQSATFLAAYAGQDKESLRETATGNFFDQCLKGANLASEPMPVASLLADEYEVRQFTDRLEMLLEAPERVYMLTLLKDETHPTDQGPAEFHVDEVTIFEDGGQTKKRLSAIYLSQAVVDLYAAALNSRDVHQLAELSSADFKERVWNQDFAHHFSILPYPNFDQGELEVVSTVFNGDLTEITVAQGESIMTYQLLLAHGWMVVDDIVMPALDRPTSMKQNLELLLPMHQFASAVMRKDLPGLIKESDEGLDRMVWRQYQEFPQLDMDIVRPLTSEVVSIFPEDSWVTVRTSDGIVQGDFRFVREGDRFVMHDVQLASEADPQQHVELVANMREKIANHQHLPRRLSPEILQASREIPVEQPAPRRNVIRDSAIQPASAQMIAPPQSIEATEEVDWSAGFDPIDASVYR